MSRSGGFLIREATPDDAAVIARFNCALALETENKRLDDAVLAAGVREALADPERLRYWVAEATEPGQVIGQAAVTREWSDWRNGWLWWFQSVYVAPEARAQGVFRALYTHIRQAALLSGEVIGLRLYVEEHNARARRTYESLGMTHGGYHVYEELWIRPQTDEAAGAS